MNNKEMGMKFEHRGSITCKGLDRVKDLGNHGDITGSGSLLIELAVFAGFVVLLSVFSYLTVTFWPAATHKTTPDCVQTEVKA